MLRVPIQRCPIKNACPFLTHSRHNASCNLPDEADVVIIGGGNLGCNLLYQLSKNGTKTVLLERSKLTSGTTWHSNGLFWRLRPSDVDIQILSRVAAFLPQLEEETGLSTGYQINGGLFIARSEERLKEYKRLHTIGKFFGIDSQILSSSDAAKIHPFLDPKSFTAALYSPKDGRLDPSMLCAAIAKAAVKHHGKIVEDCPVTHIRTDSTGGFKKITGVQTRHGIIKSNVVVNAAGVWSTAVAKMVGLDIPITAFKHAYVITDSIPEVTGTPNLRDHDASICYKTLGDRIYIGGFEMNPEVIKTVPDDLSFGLYNLDYNIFGVHIEKACELSPRLKQIGIKSDINGPEAFTPDHKPLLGEDPRLGGFYHACGFNSAGMMLGTGCAEQLAIWIIKGRPELSMHNYDIRRFTPNMCSNKRYVTQVTHEAYATNYAIAFPNCQPLAGRDLKTDALHEILVKKGAVMEQAQEWERPSYFLKDGTAPVGDYDWFGCYGHALNTDKRYEEHLEGDSTFGFSKHHNLIGEEALSARNNVALFNLSHFGKAYLVGKDAQRAASWLFTAKISDAAIATPSCVLNTVGRMEGYVTVTGVKQSIETLLGVTLKGKGYYIVTEATTGHRVLCYLQKEIHRQGFEAILLDVSEKLGLLSVQGPKSQELLQQVLDNPILQKLSLGMSGIATIDGHTCRIVRTSSIGELGYQLYIPSKSCVSTYKKLMKVGKKLGLQLAGYRAFGCLNCEKGSHIWNSDLRSQDNPIEANLLHLCNNEDPYLGREAFESDKKRAPSKKRVFVSLQAPIPLWGMETIWRNNKIVGFLRRGSYGYFLKSSIGIGYVNCPDGGVVDDKYLKEGQYEIESMGVRYTVNLHAHSPFDARNQRLLGKYNF